MALTVLKSNTISEDGRVYQSGLAISEFINQHKVVYSSTTTYTKTATGDVL